MRSANAAWVNVGVAVMALFFCEVLLQVAARTSNRAARALAHPQHRDTPYVPDAARGFRGNPKRFDHDSRGYRNATDYEQTDVLVIGDSQTYGVGVERAQAWPSVLHETTELDVYNMGIGGYAAPHHLFELDSMLHLHPETVVFAVYFGNDFLESFAIARDHPKLRAHVPIDLWDKAIAADETEPLEERISLFVRRGRPAEVDTDPYKPTLLDSLRTLVSEKVMLYALVRAVIHAGDVPETQPLLSRDFEAVKRGLEDDQRRYCSPQDDGEWRTILTAPYRGFTVDPEDPRVEAGFLVSLHALEQIIAMAEGASARMLVVLIPTKETVFASRVEDPAAHPGLARLVENEARYRGRLVDALRARRVEVVNVLPALRAASRQPYFEDADGHPNQYGHEIIAAAVATALQGPSAELLSMP